MLSLKIAIAAVALLGLVAAMPTSIVQPELTQEEAKPVVAEEIQITRNDAANAKRFKDAEDNIKKMEDELNKKKGQTAMSVKSLGDTNDKVGNLAKDLQAAQNAFDTLKAALKAAEEASAAAAAEHEATAAAAKESKAQLEADVASTKAKANKAAADLNKVQAAHGHGAEMLKSAAAALAEAEADNAEAQKAYAMAQDALSTQAAAVIAAKEQWAKDKETLCQLGSDTWHADYCKGCDGVQGSGKVVDLCGKCGGDNSSCKDCAGVPNGSAKVRDYCGHTGCEYDRKKGGCENMRRNNDGWQGAQWRELDASICGWTNWYRNEHCCRLECY